MPDEKEPIPKFAARIKAKYPEYKDVDDTLLTQRIVEKYPEYGAMVDMGGTSPTVKKKESTSAGTGGDGLSAFALEVSPEQEKIFQDTKKRYEGLSGVRVDPNDPVATAKRAILTTVKKPRITAPETRSTTAVKRPMEAALTPIEPEAKGVSYTEASKDLKQVENYYRYNTNRSVNELSKVSGLNKDQLYSDDYDEQVKQSIQPGNETQRLAYEALQDAKKANKVIQGGGALEDMAVRFAGMSDPQVQKQIEAQMRPESMDEVRQQGIGDILNGEQMQAVKPQASQMFGEGTRGRFLFDMFNNPAFKQELDSNPQLKSEYKQEAANLSKNYPDFGKMYFGNLISQKMENLGMNNGILNVVTKDEFDKVVKELKDKGEITLADEAFINQNLRSDTGMKGLGKQIIGRENIATTGLVENAFQGAVTGTENLGKGVAEATGIYEGMVGAKGALKRDIEQASTQVNVKPENVWHEVTQQGGQFLGQSLAIGGGGGLIKAAKIASNPAVALGLSGGIQAYANYLPEARMAFAGDPLKQKGYATLMSGIEALTENIFRDDKVIKGLLKEFKPLVRETIEDFTQKKISAAAAREILEGSMAKVMAKVPEAAKSFGKGVGQNTAEEVIAQGLGQITKGVFEGKPMNEWLDAEDLSNTARQAFLGSAFIAGLSTRADLMKNRGISSKQVYSMARNPSYWLEQFQESAKLDESLAAQLPDKVENLQYATELLAELDTRPDLSEKQKAKFLLTSLDSKIKEQAQSTKSDPIIRAKENAANIMGVQENNKIKEDILEGKDDGTYEGDTSDEMSKDEIKAAKILGSAKLPGMYGEMAEQNPVGVLQEIAQQAQGIDAEGKPLEGGERKEEMIEQGFPEKIIEEAIKLYPKREPSVSMETQAQPEGAAEGVAPSTLEIPKDLEEKGEQVSSSDDAKRRFSEGERIFAFDELTEQPVELRSVEHMDKYAADQLLAYPEQQTIPTNETKETTPIPNTPEATGAATGTATEAGSEAEVGEGQAGEPPIAEPPVITEGSEEDDGMLSGIRKALVSEDIVRGVNLEKIGDKEMMALGRRIIDTGEVNPRALVEKIVSENAGVLAPAQVVALITYKADIDNQLRDAYAESNRRRLQGEDQGTINVEIKNLEREVDDFDVAAVITANQQSMSFRLRQYMLDRDYNVTTQIEKYKQNNNGYIPPEIEAKFRGLDKKLKDLKKKIADEQQKKDLKEAQKAVNNIKAELERELRRAGTKMTDEQVEKRVKEGVQKEIDAIYDRLPQEKRSAAQKAIEAIQRLKKRIRGSNYSDATGIVAVIDIGLTTIENALKAGVAIAEAVEIGISKVKELLKKKGIDKWDKENDFRKDMIEGFEAEGVSTKKVNDKPIIDEDGTIKIPNQMIRGLVERGLTEIEELTDAVHAEVKKDLPDVTKRQVMDAITDYGKKVNQTADEIQQQVNTAKRVGRLLSELEDLKNKIKKEKNPSTKAKLTEKERTLKKQIRSLEKDLGISHTKEKTDEQKLSDSKERVRERIADLQRKIKNKDFAKKEKLPPPKDDELINLEAEKQKLESEFDTEQYKLKLKQRTWWQKVEDIGVELFSGLIRGLVASFDLSAGLVQGMYRMFTDIGKSGLQFFTGRKVTPNRTINAFGTMFKHLVSQKASDDYLAKIKASPAYPLMQASKLSIDDKSGHVSAKEGIFISNWVNLIWDHAIAPMIALPVTIGTKGDVRKAYDISKAINPYLASQRAFDGYINSIRVNSFKDMATSLQNSGYNYEADPEVFKKAADFINTTTGRGTLGAADASSKWLNLVLFAPRKVISEVKLFSPYVFLYYAKMPKPVRMRALGNLATFLGTFLATNALMWVASKPDDDDEEEMEIWKDFWDMRSSNFLTHKIGDKRISIAGGAKSMVVFLSRLWTGKFVDQYGNETDLGDRYGKQINTRFDLLTNFIAGKTAPVVNIGVQKFQERKGLEMDNTEVVKSLTVPIWLQDLKDLYKKDPQSVNVIATTLSIFGANVRAVEGGKNSPFTDEDKKDPVFKYFLDKGMNLPNVVPASIDVPDKETKTMKNLTDFPEEKIKQYQEEHKSRLKEELKKIKDKGYVYEDDYGNISKSKQRGYDKVDLDDLNKEQLAKILKTAQVQASAKTKEKLFPK